MALTHCWYGLRGLEKAKTHTKWNKNSRTAMADRKRSGQKTQREGHTIHIKLHTANDCVLCKDPEYTMEKRQSLQ